MADGNPPGAQGFFPPGYQFNNPAKGDPGGVPQPGADNPPARQQAETSAASGTGGTNDPNAPQSGYTPPANPYWKPGDTPYNPMTDPQNVLGVGVRGGLDPSGQVWKGFTPQQQQIAAQQVQNMLNQGYSMGYIRNWFNNYAANPDAYAQQQGAVGPALSSQNLNEYTRNFLIPFVDHVSGMVQGDMNQWGSAIQKLVGMGLPSNVAKDMSPTSGEIALYQTLAPLMAQQVLTQPYTSMINTMMGQGAQQGARLDALTSQMQNLMGFGAIQPGSVGIGSVNPIQAGNLPNAAGTNATASNLPAGSSQQSLSAIANLMNPNTGSSSLPMG